MTPKETAKEKRNSLAKTMLNREYSVYKLVYASLLFAGIGIAFWAVTSVARDRMNAEFLEFKRDAENFRIEARRQNSRQELKSEQLEIESNNAKRELEAARTERVSALAELQSAKIQLSRATEVIEGRSDWMKGIDQFIGGLVVWMEGLVDWMTYSSEDRITRSTVVTWIESFYAANDGVVQVEIPPERKRKTIGAKFPEKNFGERPEVPE